MNELDKCINYYQCRVDKLTKQLQKAKEGNKQLAQQNKQMREALYKIKEYAVSWHTTAGCECAEIAKQALGGK